MRIRKITLENFQSYAYTEINLHEGLNVIVGESDRGKSAIIRALNWLIYNEPRGADFIRAGERECRVTVQLEDGSIVQRERTPSLNRYIVNKPGADLQVYEGFGTKVPEEVKKVLGVERVCLDDDLEVSLNISKQLDRPFLISESGSVKSKSIGRLYNVHVIDAAVRDTVQDINELQREDRRLDLEITEIDERIKEFEDVPVLEERLEKAELLMKQLENLRVKSRRLISLAERKQVINNDYLYQQKVIDRLAGINQACNLMVSLEQLVKRERTLLQLKEELKLYRKGISNALKVIEATRNLMQGTAKAAAAAELIIDYESLNLLQKKLNLTKTEQLIEKSKLAATENITAAGIAVEQINASLRKAEELKNLAAKLKILNEDKRSIIFILSRTEGLESAAVKIINCDNQEARLTELARSFENLKDVKSRIDKGIKYVEERRRYIREGLKQYEAMLRRMGRCPVCLGKVDAETIERIILQFGG